ncbi:MAG: ribosome silencing factor [Acidobacteriota bacterium]
MTELSATPTPTRFPVDIPARVRSAVEAADGRKALEIRVLHLGAVTSFTEYFILATGTSERQTQAISDAIEERLRNEGVRPLSIEGQQRGQWVLLDYGDFLVHVFTTERRSFYGLEKLWGDAPDATREFLPIAPTPAAQQPAPTQQGG